MFRVTGHARNSSNRSDGGGPPSPRELLAVLSLDNEFGMAKSWLKMLKT